MEGCTMHSFHRNGEMSRFCLQKSRISAIEDQCFKMLYNLYTQGLPTRALGATSERHWRLGASRLYKDDSIRNSLKPLQRKPRKNAEAPTGFEPMSSTIPVRCSTNWELKQVKSVGAQNCFYGLCNCFSSCFITVRITFLYVVMCILKGFWRLNVRLCKLSFLGCDPIT